MGYCSNSCGINRQKLILWSNINNRNYKLSYFFYSEYIDSPLRICDALPLSSRREGERPLADVG